MNRLLIVGCGDIGVRVAARLQQRCRLYALTHSASRLPALRAVGAAPILADLDQPRTLIRLAGLAQMVLHLAPPPLVDHHDSRTANLLAALGRRSLPQHFIYMSTSGVYGDCGGACVTEASVTRPSTARAQRRVDAERQVRAWGARCGVRVSILRVPGIYAETRLPLARLEKGTPALNIDDDVYVNHIHADDLATIVIAAMYRGQPNRTYHASDDLPQKMADYFDAVADRFQLPRPPRLARVQLQAAVSPQLYSFMSESRRLSNQRMKQELRVQLAYPTVAHGLAAASRGQAHAF